MTTTQQLPEKVCSGCGVPLQTIRPDEPGFVPESALTRESPVCKRCFRIRNYGEFSRIVVPHEVYEREVSSIAAHPGLVLYVVDVFDLPGSLIPDLSKLIGSSQVIVLVNKVDLLPKEVHVTALEKWIRKELRVVGVNPLKVLFVSGQSGFGADAVLDAMGEVKTDVTYVVGMANVGKSTLLNRWIQSLSGIEPFTASRVPGTTLGVVSARVTLSDGRDMVLVDTPGLIHGDRIIDCLCGDCLKVATPQSAIRPRVYQLDAGQTLWLGGFARFDFISGPHQPVVCYVSNQLVIHRTKWERAEAIYEEHSDDILQAPCGECRRELGPFSTYEFKGVRQKPLAGQEARVLDVPITGCDIVLSGLGWITLQGQHIRGELMVPKNIRVTVRPRLIGQLSRGLHT